MTKIPKQLFVTARGTAGFLHPHGTGSAADKRQKIQMDWAYGYSTTYETRDDGLVWIEQKRWVRAEDEQLYNIVVTTKVAEFQPAIWENDPLEGFTIADTVSRSSTSNKLWLIKDPRGLNFEITTACMETILAETAVYKSKLLGKFVWTSNKHLKCVEPYELK